MDWILLQIPSPLSTLMILAGKASVLLGLASLIRRFQGRMSASTRCYSVTATIIIVAALPLLAPIMPNWEPPIPAIVQSHPVLERITLPQPEIVPGIITTASSDSKVSAVKMQTLTSSSRSENLIMFVWLLGTAIAAGRILIGLIGSLRDRRAAMRVDSKRILGLIRVASARLGLRKNVTVLISRRTGVPYVNGVVKPVLYLPSNVLRWPEERLMSALLHELAHIKRGDHFVWPLVNLAVTWLWFNPLAWIALAHIKRDREMACDDRVLACGSTEATYARHLLEACTSLRVSMRLASISLLFARKNDVSERVRYMLSRKLDRRPISRTRQLSFAVLLMMITIPLVSISGFSSNTVALQDVDPQERDAVVSTLEQFYGELSNGSDYHTVRDRFLSSDYFENPNLTLENLDKAVWRPVFDNTLSLLTETAVGAVREVRTQITSIRRNGEEVIVTQQLDVVAYRNTGEVEYDAFGSAVIRPDHSSAKETSLEDCHLVNSLTQQIRLRHEDGFWRISQFDDGVAIMRMDTINPYGPIFLIWIEDIDAQTTPFGATIFKVIPSDVVPGAHNARFLVEK